MKKTRTISKRFQSRLAIIASTLTDVEKDIEETSDITMLGLKYIGWDL